jgi:hypothetical protein
MDDKANGPKTSATDCSREAEAGGQLPGSVDVFTAWIILSA